MTRFFHFFYWAGLVNAYFQVRLFGGLVVLMPGHSWRQGCARIAGGRLFVDWSFFRHTGVRKVIALRTARLS